MTAEKNKKVRKVLQMQTMIIFPQLFLKLKIFSRTMKFAKYRKCVVAHIYAVFVVLTYILSYVGKCFHHPYYIICV